MCNRQAMLLLILTLLSPCAALETFAAAPSYRWVFNADAIGDFNLLKCIFKKLMLFAFFPRAWDLMFVKDTELHSASLS